MGFNSGDITIEKAVHFSDEELATELKSIEVPHENTDVNNN